MNEMNDFLGWKFISDVQDTLLGGMCVLSENNPNFQYIFQTKNVSHYRTNIGPL